MLENLNEQICELAGTVLQERPFFVVEVEVRGHKGRRTVEIYIDSEKEGITLDECAKISNELGLLIDAQEIIEGSYRLNISSPGLDRPLTDRRQYLKNVGRRARIRYKQNDEEQRTEGVIKNFSDDRLVLTEKDGTIRSVDYEDILETKILTAW